jgi:tetratricopeptide (TPR) repeat protein
MLLIVACTAMAYSNSLTGGFVFDDWGDIADKHEIRRLWPIWHPFVTSREGKTSIHSRPLVALSFALNYACRGLVTWPYHVTNLVIHIAGALILFGIVRRTLLLPRGGNQGSNAAPLALAIALIWALHPLGTQAVSYIVQRYESMMGLFYLTCLYCAIRAFSSSRRRPWMVASVTSCLLAMSCKEVAVSAPIVVLLYDRTFMSGTFREIWRRRPAFYACLASTWLVFLPLYTMYSGGNGLLGTQGFAGFGYKYARLAWHQYALNQTAVILHYLRLCIWPIGQAADYGWPPARTLTELLPSAFLIGGLLAATVWGLLRRSAWGFLGAAFFLILAPTSSIMPIVDLAFEHRMYLPLAAVTAALVMAAYGLLARGPSNPTLERNPRFWGAVLSLALVLGSLTFLRNRVYSDEQTFWTAVLAKRPDNPRGHFALGTALMHQDQYLSAIPEIKEAMRLQPDNPDRWKACNNLGACMLNLRRYGEAMAYFLEALKLNPNDSLAHLNLAAMLAERNRNEAAFARFLCAIDVDPNLLHEAEAPGQVGQAPSLLAHLSRCFHLPQDQVLRRPIDWPLAHFEFGTALVEFGMIAQAVNYFDSAVKMDPPSVLKAEIESRRAASLAALRQRDGSH